MAGGADLDTAKSCRVSGAGTPDPESLRTEQRRRLHHSIATACAIHGYGATTVSGLLASAGVSRASFYEIYANKEECLLGAHRDYSSLLLEVIDGACERQREWPAKLSASVEAALAHLTPDPAMTQLLSITVLACGRRGADQHRAMIDALASRYRSGFQASEVDNHSETGWEIVIASVASIVGKAARHGGSERISALTGELIELLLEAPAMGWLTKSDAD
jgi:AcrR family transcriptional regulator